MRRHLAFGLAILALGLAAVASAAPPGPAPKVSGAGTAPPPAWIEVGGRQVWLAYTSYCWKTTCVDFLPPDARPDVPTVVARRGAVARLHFAFRPTRVTVATATGLASQTRLAAARTVSWRISRPGLVIVTAKSPSAGDASYLVRLKLR